MALGESFYFCPMRKVRVHLKRLHYYSNVTFASTFSIFMQNTDLYLKGQISRKFYANLAEELWQRSTHYAIWNKTSDTLLQLLKTAVKLGNKNSKAHISRINHEIENLNQQCMSFHPLSSDLRS